MITRNLRLIAALFILAVASSAFVSNAFAEQVRFPQPEFSEGYVIPATASPSARADIFEYADVLILAVFLAAAAFFAIKKRSRKALYLTAAAAVIYFGFFRRGCVCSIGSVQNVTLSFSDPAYLIPLPILFFFILPLLAALFFGRVFCSSVCPLGALQELVIFKPIRVPRVLALILGFIPYVFLGLAVVFAASGAGFIICRLDPFVGFFRLGGPPVMLAAGALFLAGGVFVARPYCRFVCPYGVILGVFSYFSKRHLSITPSECINCRLCADSCPVDAINTPSPKERKIPEGRRIRKIGLLLILMPAFSLLTGWGLSRSAGFLSGYNRQVRLARELSGDSPEDSLELQAFRGSVTPEETLFVQAQASVRRFRTGLWFMGIFLGAVIFIRLLYSLVKHNRQGYEPDKFHCLSCGRCMEYCPVKAPGAE